MQKCLHSSESDCYSKSENTFAPKCTCLILRGLSQPSYNRLSRDPVNLPLKLSNKLWPCLYLGTVAIIIQNCQNSSFQILGCGDLRYKHEYLDKRENTDKSH